MKKIIVISLVALLLVAVTAFTTYRTILKTMSIEVANNQAIVTVAGQSDVYDIQ